MRKLWYTITWSLLLAFIGYSMCLLILPLLRESNSCLFNRVYKLLLSMPYIFVPCKQRWARIFLLWWLPYLYGLSNDLKDENVVKELPDERLSHISFLILIETVAEDSYQIGSFFYFPVHSSLTSHASRVWCIWQWTHAAEFQSSLQGWAGL